jgi:hypothetical protein
LASPRSGGSQWKVAEILEMPAGAASSFRRFRAFEQALCRHPDPAVFSVLGGWAGWFIFENRSLLDMRAVFAGLLTVIVIGLIFAPSSATPYRNGTPNRDQEETPRRTP